jgi:hypothetical protein
MLVEQGKAKQGPKFEIIIEGKLYAWDRETITCAELRTLAGFPSDVALIEVDLKENTERTLSENEEIPLKPGMGFGKKVSFKRGRGGRLESELEMLRQLFPQAVYCESARWVRIPNYRLPPGVWEQAEVELCVQVPENYPGQAPYAFYTFPAVRARATGGLPNSSTYPAQTPFGADWLKFSWSVEPWLPKNDPMAGCNLLNFVLSAGNRLREGA